VTLRILSDSETGRHSAYTKEVDEFIENGLTAQRIQQGTEGIGRQSDLSENQRQSATTMADLSDQAGASAAMTQQPTTQKTDNPALAGASKQMQIEAQDKEQLS